MVVIVSEVLSGVEIVVLALELEVEVASLEVASLEIVSLEVASLAMWWWRAQWWETRTENRSATWTVFLTDGEMAREIEEKG